MSVGVDTGKSKSMDMDERPWLVWSLCVAAAVLFVPVGAGCGDDAGSSSSSNRARRRPTPPTAGGQRGGAPGAGGGLIFYDKVEKYAGDPEEAENIREPFEPLEDFTPDGDGVRNRDPFRSYIIRQPGPDARTTLGETQSLPDACDEKEHIAPNFPLRELQLVGIILRGTRSYALFRDSATYGYVVRKGDCLGQEKAKVMAIRAGFVSLQVTPETGNDEVVPVPQDRVIPLYPDEFIPETSP